MGNTWIGGRRLRETDGGANSAEVNVDGASGDFKINNVAVTSTAAELNEVDDVTSFASSTIAVAAEAGGNSITVTVTLKDAAGVAVNEARLVTMWLSSSATTGAIAAATSGGASFSTGLAVKVVTTGVMWEAISSTSGVLALDIVEEGALGPLYLWVRLPNGKSLVSGAITFAA